MRLSQAQGGEALNGDQGAADECAAGDHFHGGGLARAVRPKMTRNFAAGRAKAHILHCGDTGVMFGSVSYLPIAWIFG